MTQFKTEGQPAFPVPNTETENSTESSPEKTSTEQTPSQGENQNSAENKGIGDGKENAGAEDQKDRGFADDPRWKEREENWNKRFNDQETRHVDELGKVREGIQTQIDAALKAAGVAKPADNAGEGTPAEVPDWFGGDEKQWAGFQKWNSTLLAQAEERGAQKAIKGIEEKSAGEQKAIQEATDYMNAEVTAIESDQTLNPKGDKVDKNKLLKFVLDNDLVDSKGRWNYKAAYRMMNAGTTQSTNQSIEDRKKLAGATTGNEKPEVKPQPYVTSDTFNKPGERPW